jgi:hypothetical protein
VNLTLVHLGVAQSLGNRFNDVAEKIGTQFLEAGTGEARVEIDAVKERVNLNAKIMNS